MPTALRRGAAGSIGLAIERRAAEQGVWATFEARRAGKGPTSRHRRAERSYRNEFRRAHNPKVAIRIPPPLSKPPRAWDPQALQNRPTETSKAAERWPSSLGEKVTVRGPDKRVSNAVVRMLDPQP